MKYILMDVEGTTTSISFVHDTLFPYSFDRIENYIQEHSERHDVKDILNLTQMTIAEEENKTSTVTEQVAKLKEWIKQDRKHGALKKLQGLIWDEGYKSGKLQGHVYPDVPEALLRWKNAGLKMGIYSSGSVGAQIALFGHSVAGDLCSFFSHHFDTAVGHKRESSSYKNILNQINLEGDDVLFLSDIAEELDAASAVGFKTLQVVRTTPVAKSKHRQISSFSEITF